MNVTLAELMTELGADSKAETIVRSPGKKTYPDIRTERAGLRVVMEAKYEGPGSADAVTAQVEERLEDALGELGVAIVYPEEVKEATNIRTALTSATLRARFAAPASP